MCNLYNFRVTVRQIFASVVYLKFLKKWLNQCNVLKLQTIYLMCKYQQFQGIYNNWYRYHIIRFFIKCQYSIIKIYPNLIFEFHDESKSWNWYFRYSIYNSNHIHDSIYQSQFKLSEIVLIGDIEDSISNEHDFNKI